MIKEPETLESTSQKRVRKAAVQDAIIGAIALTGILVVAVAAPNAVRLFKDLHIASRDPRQRFRERISKMKKTRRCWSGCESSIRMTFIQRDTPSPILNS